MPTTAEQLLSAREPLPFPARLLLTARTSRRLADEGGLPAARRRGRARSVRAAARGAGRPAGQDAGFLGERLADPDPVVARYAVRAARVLPVPDETVEAAYDEAPAALRRHGPYSAGDGASAR